MNKEFDNIGQLLIVGIKESKMNKNLEQFIEEIMPAGIILFKHNLINRRQTKKLIKDLQKISEVPLFICIDHEGGKVVRFHKKYGIKQYPNLYDFSKNASPKKTKQMGYDFGDELRDLGINVNFAPVLDLSTNQNNTVTYSRSFSSNPYKVAKFGELFIRAMQSKNVLACAKHFPGIGEAVIDPHKNLAEIKLSLKQLQKRELIPFISAIKSGVQLIMPSHIYYNKIDKEEKVPATLSKNIITKILKKGIGYNGVVVSDDMTMGAIIKRKKFEEDCYRSIFSGIDILLICWDSNRKARRIIKYFMNRNREGDELFRKRLHESLHKVMILKKKMRT